MAVRYYLTPGVSGGHIPGSIQAAHLPAGVPWAGMDYGKEALFLVRIDVTAGQHTTLAAFSDVFAFPADLTSTISGGVLTAAKAKLEALKLPADWLTAATTIGQALRMLAKFCELNQRVHGQTGLSLFAGAITPDTTVAQLTTGQRNALAAALASLGLSTSQVTGATTLRQILKGAADALGAPVFG